MTDKSVGARECMFKAEKNTDEWQARLKLAFGKTELPPSVKNLNNKRPLDEGEDSGRSSKSHKKDPKTPDKVESKIIRTNSSSSVNSSVTQSDGHPITQITSGSDKDIDGYGTDATPENKPIHHFSETQPSLQKIGALVFGRFADPKFADACEDAIKGMKQLEEVLRTITKVREQLCDMTKRNDN